MVTTKHNDIAEHVEMEATKVAPLADYDTIEREGEAVLLSIVGDAEAAATHLKLAKDGHVSCIRPRRPRILP